MPTPNAQPLNDTTDTFENAAKGVIFLRVAPPINNESVNKFQSPPPTEGMEFPVRERLIVSS